MALLYPISKNSKLASHFFRSVGRLLARLTEFSVMEPASIRLLQEFWVEDLGCSSDDLTSNGVKVVSHGTLSGYPGVYFFRCKRVCIVSAPERLLPQLKQEVAHLSAEACFSREAVRFLFEGRFTRLVGPAWLGKIDSNSFRPCHGIETRLLHGEDDWQCLELLLAACGKAERNDSSLAPNRMPTAGVFLQGKLVAAAGYEILFGKIAHIGVLCHPNQRGKGFATNAVSKITEVGLNTELGLQYQTLCANLSSVRTAQKIGFTEFAQTIAARFGD